MSVLEDEGRLREGDPAGMLEAFLSLPAQLVDAYVSTRARGGLRRGPRSVTFCGMGGSAAGGDVAVAAFADRLAVPHASVRGYRLPAHCGPEDLVVCLSFSGGTAETLACYGEAVARGCRVAAISSGGELAARAEADGTARFPLSSDVPMPRAGLGLLAGAAVGVLAEAGLVPDPTPEVHEARDTLAALSAELRPRVRRNEAKATATWVGDRMPVVWGSEGPAAAAAWRWKCAFNENAKVPAFASALPELDHHEVAGWSAGRGGGFALVVLREDGEHPGVGARVAASLRAVEGSGLEAREVRARGSSPLARTLSLILLGDAASTYHALGRGVDPAPIEAIAGLKDDLAEGA